MRHYAVSGLRPVLTGAQSKVIEFPSPMNGRITQLMVRIAESNPNGDAVFDVNINGVTVYASPGDRATIETGDTTGVSMINTEIAVNDMITVDLDAAPLGGISGLYVIIQLEDSPTLTQYIQNIYQQAVRRDPTGPELSDAIADLTAGCNAVVPLGATHTLLTLVFTDTEYTSSFGATNAEYIEDLYQAILARPSDAGGKAFWINEMTLGLSRADLLSIFNGSLEHTNQRVIGWCPHVLPLTDAVRIQGVDIDITAPTDLQALIYLVSTGRWTAMDLPSGSLPTGGSIGQVLTKQSGADGDADWETPSAGGGSSGRPSSTDDPIDESDLELWLRADKYQLGALVNDGIVGYTWFDLSPHARDALLIQYSGTTVRTNINSAIYKATGGPNSQAAVLNTGSCTHQLPGFLSDAWTHFEAFVIVKMSTNGVGGSGNKATPLSAWGSGSSGAILYSDGNWYDDVGSATRPSTGDPAADMMQWRCLNYQITPSTANGWKLYIDNTLHHQYNSGALSFGLSPRLWLTQDGNAGDGYIAEIIIFSTLGHRANLLSYLNTRYGFSLT